MKWAVDAAHSEVGFAVKHLGIATVRGRFGTFNADIETDDGRLTRVAVTIDAGSVDTRDAKRDAHLRSGDFLETEKYPAITFTSSSITPAGENRYTVAGPLTMHGQTHDVRFDVEVAPPVKDPWGNQRAAASGRGVVNRKQWGLGWNMALEAGGWLVGEDVQFSFEVESTAQAAAAAR
jgi:polyisoprenoid-binding protein YceI